ncbi:MAG: geranylgeranyl reductase family protein, partial [Acidilobaceae archaeon]
MPQRLDYDVVVVGLGPAGTALTYFLRKSGLKVLGLDLVDESRVWSKPCGDAIGAGYFDSLDLPHPSGSEVKTYVSEARVYGPSEEAYVSFRGEKAGYIFDRHRYGLKLLKEAERAGVEIWLNTKALHPIVRGERLEGVRAKRGEEEFELLAKVIVDATGAQASIRYKLPQEWPVVDNPDETDFNLAYRKILELEDEISDPETIRLYFNTEVAPGGYWWLFPEGRTAVNLGLGVQMGKSYPSPKELFERYLASRREVKRVKRIISDGGAKLPTRRPLKTMVWNNFIAIGDSAYTVNPVHGGGIGYAMTAAKYAAESILEAYSKNDYSARGLWKLNLLYMREVGSKQASLDVYRMFLQTLSNDEIEWAVRKFSSQELAVALMEGELRLDMSFLDKVKIIASLVNKPGLLLKLVRANDYARELKSLYR